MTDTPCVRCERPTDGILICNGCTSTWRAHLKRIPWLLDQLQIAATRQTRVTRENRHDPAPIEDVVAVAVEKTLPANLRSKQGRIVLAPHALPVDIDAATQHTTVMRTLTGWVQQLTDVTTDPRLTGRTILGPLCPDPLCWHRSCIRLRGVPARPVDIAAYLIALTPRMRRQPAAAAWIDQLHQTVRDIENLVFPDEPEVFAGACDAPDLTWIDHDDTIRIDLTGDGPRCNAQLFARLGADTVTCRVCGVEYDIAERREWMLDAIRVQCWTPVKIASALTSLNMPLSAKTLMNWIDRDARCLASGRAIQDTDGVWRNPRTGLRLILPIMTEYQDDLGNDLLDEAGEPVGRLMYQIGHVQEVMLARALAEHARGATA